ncbi:hypothetical protein A2U01_0085925, partial [Trifolium medium]|nr:hypothetical protein [Trifolium medium]
MAFVVWNEWFTVHHLQRHNVVPVDDPRSGVISTGLCFRNTNGQFVAG